jgi:ABC-type Fe3+-hydroxamate transport system substrate-binding protein
MIFKDQIGQELELQVPVKRIVSLVPSQTELLHALGLEDEVVGLTKFCIHPEKWWREKKRVGGTKNVSIEKVRELKPDLVIGNKEENFRENIEELKEIVPVWMSDISNLKEALAMISDIGEITGKSLRANEIIQDIQTNFSRIKKLENSPKVLYFIWKKPWMCAGKDTFIDHMLTLCGFDNAATMNRYPTIEEKEFPDVEYVFLSSEPYPFKEKDVLEMKEFFPNAKIIIVDGEYFSWYGSRLIGAPEYLNRLISILHG